MDRYNGAFDRTQQGLGEMPTVTPADGISPPALLTTTSVGQVLDGKYQLVRLLGEGGMGAVYEAIHAIIGSRVAVKVLHPEAAKQPESLARFQREAKAAGTIGHPNIVRVHDLGQTPSGLPYMVMDYVEGRSLAEIIFREAPLEPSRAVALAVQVLSALGAAHSKGIVHRDVKPENVLVSVEGGAEVARVLDFGISKFRELGPDRQGLTRTGTVLGTPLYMAPEQARGETDIDHRIDLYALGVSLYVMLTGQQPFRASNYNALLIKIVTEAPPPLVDLRPELPRELTAVVERAMARDRRDRFSTAEGFIAALTGQTPAVEAYGAAPADDVQAVPPFSAQTPTTLVPTSAPGRRRRGVWLTLSSLVALVVAGGAVVGVLALTPGERPAEVPAQASPRSLAQPPSDVAPAAVPERAPDQAPDTAPSPPAEPAQVWLSIKTVPADAVVVLDGRRLESPAKVALPREGDRSAVVEVSAEGYEPQRREVPLGADADLLIELVRRRSKARPPRESTGSGLHIKGVGD